MIAHRSIELTTLRCACLLLLLLLGVSACSDTGNSANDTLSAQRLLPNLSAYTATNVDTSMDGAFAAMGGAALMGGQVGITAVIAKLEQVLQCFQDRGALAAKFYSQTETDGGLPHVGAALVINQSRINQEMINCALGGQEETISSQNVNLEPCANAGTFTYEDNTISYVYVGSHPDVCALYELHFNNLANQSESEQS